MAKLDNLSTGSGGQNDYFKVLQYLQRFQDDSEFHNIETLLGEGENSFQKSKHYKRIIQELAFKKFIEVKTGSGGMLQIILFGSAINIRMRSLTNCN